MIQHNLHTHTYRCKHAAGDAADYCRAALDQGLSVLGISDHAALPDNHWLSVRMEFSELSDYSLAVDRAREAFPELRVLKSMECDHAPEYGSLYQETLLGQLGFDYLIGSMHNVPHQGEWLPVYGGTNDAATLRSYARWMVEAMECGWYSFMAHPDLFANAYHCWDGNAAACSRDILAAAEGLRVPLEINGYGLRKSLMETADGLRHKYPWRPFWELASDYDVLVVVTSDAHRPQDVAASIDEGKAIAREFSLQLADLAQLVPCGAALGQD